MQQQLQQEGAALGLVKTAVATTAAATASTTAASTSMNNDGDFLVKMGSDPDIPIENLYKKTSG